MSGEDRVAVGPDAGGDPGVARDTFEQVPVILGGLTGPEHRFDAANAAYRALMGGRTDVIGRSAAEVFPERLSQQVLDLCDRVYESGVPASIREWRFQLGVGETGELREFYMDVTFAPRREADGSVTGLTLWARDATQRVRERQRAQARAAEAERRCQAARDVVLELQQALLPAALPVLPGVEVAARYLVASRDQAAGGDWFDAVPLNDGRLALVVGDIVGHGVSASAAMGQLRAVLATVLAQTGELGQALGWAASMASRSPSMRAATVCAAALDPVTGVVDYVTCGHPAPLVIAADGSTRYLPATGGGPLGTGSGAVFGTATLAAGEVLLLYTDGLIERPGRSMQQGMATLARVAGDAVANRIHPIGASDSATERLCQQAVELLTRTGYEDDVTVLALQRRAEPITPLQLERRAQRGELAGMRSQLRDWLRHPQVSQDDVESLTLAFSELAANVIEHAYPPERPGPIRLDVRLGADGVVEVQVADDGTWHEPDGPRDTGGRGLWLAGEVIDELHIDRHHGPDDWALGSGTVVRLRHRLRRPAMPADEPTGPASRRPDTEFSIGLDDGPPRVLRVSGPVDIASAERFARRLDTASRGGVHPVTVDLTDVDVLASAGVRVLFAARDEYAAHGHTLPIVAATDSAAAQVLELVGLEHRRR